MKATDFFSQNPVFRVEQFVEHRQSGGDRSQRTIESLLAYHVRVGHLIRIKRGLYAVIPAGFGPDSYFVDPYLVVMGLAEDAVISHSSALQFFGETHSIHSLFPFLSHHSVKQMAFQGQHFIHVCFPRVLVKNGRESYAVEEYRHAGSIIRITNHERTLVDVLTRPDLCGGWEETWRSLESIEFLDLDQVVEYSLLLRNSTTVAKVGFFLETNRKQLMVEESHLNQLVKYAPNQPRYMERAGRASGSLVSRWNLIVPNEILDRKWEEMT